MAQPTGPQPGDDGAGTPPSPPARAAAGRETSFSTRRFPQPGQRTSASSFRRMISSSKERWQALQEYS